MAVLGLRRMPRKAMLAIRLAVFILCLLPALEMVVNGFRDQLGADPIERLLRDTGETALKILVLTLSVTPLRHVLDWNWLLGIRRMLGLFMFFYVFGHFSIYLALDRGFDLSTIVEDVLDRRFITVGFAAFVLLWPLAATSNAWAVRSLGVKKWTRLHKCVYAIAVLSCIHFLWLVKGEDIEEPLVFMAIFAGLFASRIFRWRRMRSSSVSEKRISAT